MKAKTSTQRRHIQKEVVDKPNPYIHLIMGYVFLGLVFLGAISSVYYWEYKAKAGTSYVQNVAPKHVESGEQVPDIPGTACEDNSPAKARHKETGEVREFPTPCHADKDWWELIN